MKPVKTVAAQGSDCVKFMFALSVKEPAMFCDSTKVRYNYHEV
jgi:hypothetical protein